MSITTGYLQPPTYCLLFKLHTATPCQHRDNTAHLLTACCSSYTLQHHVNTEIIQPTPEGMEGYPQRGRKRVEVKPGAAIAAICAHRQAQITTKPYTFVCSDYKLACPTTLQTVMSPCAHEKNEQRTTCVQCFLWC